QGTGGDDWAFWRRGGFDRVERHDDRVLLFATRLAEGEHTFTYVARATTSGTFRTAPTHVEEMYEPEVFGRTASAQVTVRPRGAAAGGRPGRGRGSAPCSPGCAAERCRRGCSRSTSAPRPRSWPATESRCGRRSRRRDRPAAASSPIACRTRSCARPWPR